MGASYASARGNLHEGARSTLYRPHADDRTQGIVHVMQVFDFIERPFIAPTLPFPAGRTPTICAATRQPY